MKTSFVLANVGLTIAIATSLASTACGDDEGSDGAGGSTSRGGSTSVGGTAGDDTTGGVPVVTGGASGSGAPSGGAGEGGSPATGGIDASGGAEPFDAQTPPADADAMAEWLDAGFYEDWACEPEPTTKTEGASAIHVHGRATRVCANIVLATSSPNEEGEFPVGSASVKEVYSAAGELEERVVSLKARAESGSGEGWFWYASPSAAGFGLAACTGCHAAAGSDRDHPGAGDFVYFKVRDEAELPPIDASAMQAWLDDGHYTDWTCEAEPSTKTDGAAAIHVHGKTRVCTNSRLARASGSGEFPAGVASVKEVYSGDEIASFDVYLKVSADTAGGDGWFWYGGSASTSGLGLASCTGCHGAAGTDADHPGAGDFVYFRN